MKNNKVLRVESKTYKFTSLFSGYSWKSLFELVFGVVLASIGLKAFLLPNNFLDGGVTGVAILLNTVFSWNISIVLILLSLPFLVLGYTSLSKAIAIRSALIIVVLSVMIEFEVFPIVTDDKLLIAFFGGGFLGAGIGLAIRSGTVLDGTEILGIYINRKLGIRIGTVILLFNTILFIIAAVYISTEIALYSILTYFVTAKVIDLTVAGFEDFIGLIIISEKHQIIAQRLYKETGIGMTMIDVNTGKGKTGIKNSGVMIQTVINRIDVRKVEQIVADEDEQAFIAEFDVNQVKGGALRRF